jgi:hypothetical protein
MAGVFTKAVRHHLSTNASFSIIVRKSNKVTSQKLFFFSCLRKLAVTKDEKTTLQARLLYCCPLETLHWEWFRGT